MLHGSTSRICMATEECYAGYWMPLGSIWEAFSLAKKLEH